MQVVLSLFPGADLLGMAFEAEGFCVIRGPDILLGGDIRNFHVPSGRFDGIIGGPPCPFFSIATVDRSKCVDMTAEFVRVVREARPRWWLMENVPQSNRPFDPCWWDVLDAHDFGTPQRRRRLFCSNIDLSCVDSQRLPPGERHPDPWPTVMATENKFGPVEGARNKVNSRATRRASTKVGRRMTLPEINVAMGLPYDWETPALTVEMSYRVRGNGVPLQLGRALAKAIRFVTEGTQ